MARRRSRSSSRYCTGDLLDAIRAAGLTIADLATTAAALEQAFLRLTGSGQRAANGEGSAAATTADPSKESF